MFTIENPGDSMIFKSFPLVKLAKSCEVFVVKFHQCAFGLTLPGHAPNTFCQKFTAFASNYRGIMLLERRCPGLGLQHRHEHAWGSLVVDGVSISLAKAAGAYPEGVVQAVANVVVDFVRGRA